MTASLAQWLGSSTGSTDRAIQSLAAQASNDRIPPSCVVHTPPSLAAAMVAAIAEGPNDRWLDPCVGRGAFVLALADHGVKPRFIRALDLDPTPNPSDRLATTLRPTEFLAWSALTDESFSHVVANPPYAALGRMPQAVQAAARRIAIHDGSLLPGSANTWSAFLAGSLRVLRPGGNLCFVLPAAWEFADYGERLRIYLPTVFRQVVTHRCKVPLFDDVSEGCCVLIARGFATRAEPGLQRIGSSRFEYSSPSELHRGIVPGATERRGIALGPSDCTRLALSAVRPGSLARFGGSGVRLGDMISVQIGAVTGDSAYFVLSDSQRRQHQLPTRCLTPVLSRARHLTQSAIDLNAWKALRDLDERVWLFRPTDANRTEPAVRRYLELERHRGGCNRDAYKVKSRTPWYRPNLPKSPDGFMTGMSTWGPWVVFNEVPKLSATNTLYLVRFLVGTTRDEQAAWAMWLLSSPAQIQLRHVSRTYAAGLVKYEPGDITGLELQTPSRIRGAFDAYRRAVAMMLSGARDSSRLLADGWFRHGKLTRR